MRVCVCASSLLRYFETSLKEHKLVRRNFLLEMVTSCKSLWLSCLLASIPQPNAFFYFLTPFIEQSGYLLLLSSAFQQSFNIYIPFLEGRGEQQHAILPPYFAYQGLSDSGQFCETVKYCSAWKKAAKMLQEGEFC